jgi:hypothetical protein
VGWRRARGRNSPAPGQGLDQGVRGGAEIGGDVARPDGVSVRSGGEGREVLITRLDVRGVGGEHTGIKAVAQFVTRTYQRCGSRRVETCPAGEA